MASDEWAAIRTVADALRLGRAHLARTPTDSPRLDAELLLRHALGLDRTALFVRLPDAIAPEALTAYRGLLAQRAQGLPVAYLTGEREFMGLPFTVGPDVLVPRPETEILVEWALGWLGNRKDAVVVDVGTGSGAVALSLATLLPADEGRRIIAVDVSDAALAMAARNRARLGLQDRVDLVQGTLLAPISSPVDLVLANLPYLRPEQIAQNPHLAAEPRLALDGGADGLGLVRQLLRQAPHFVRFNGAIGLEIDPCQSEAVADLARAAFPVAAISVLADLAGHERHVIIDNGRTAQS